MDHTDFINGLRYAFTYKANGIIDTTLPKLTTERDADIFKLGELLLKLRLELGERIAEIARFNDWRERLCEPELVRADDVLGNTRRNCHIMTALCDEIERLRKELQRRGGTGQGNGAQEASIEGARPKASGVRGPGLLPNNAVLATLADPDPRLGRGNGAMDA